MTGDEELLYSLYPSATPQAITEFLLWHPQNSNAVTASVTRARENARSVREPISSEMWGQLNRLYFLLRDGNRNAVLANPGDFFGQVRDGSQAFQGITAATVTHSEPYQFVQLGLYLERADKTARILNTKNVYISRLKNDSAETALQLIARLRSCSAFEPFRRTAIGELNSRRVADIYYWMPSFRGLYVFVSITACMPSPKSAVKAAPNLKPNTMCAWRSDAIMTMFHPPAACLWAMPKKKWMCTWRRRNFSLDYYGCAPLLRPRAK